MDNFLLQISLEDQALTAGNMGTQETDQLTSLALMSTKINN